VITPIVGWLEPAPAAWSRSEAEVAEVAEIPWARFLEPGAVEILGEVERLVPVYSYKIDGRNIWGATARILHELLELVG
jgi:hypothetical protein